MLNQLSCMPHIMKLMKANSVLLYMYTNTCKILSLSGMLDISLQTTNHSLVYRTHQWC